MQKLIVSAMFLLSLCGACLGQSRFQGITPATSTRDDVAKILGQPIRQINPAFFEYKPPAGVAKVEIEYGTVANTQVVRHIEVYFVRPISRPALIKTFSLPQQPELSVLDDKKRLVEYFGNPAFMGLTYVDSDKADGVAQAAYYGPVTYGNILAVKMPKHQPGIAAQGQNTPAAPKVAPPKVTTSGIGTTTRTDPGINRVDPGQPASKDSAATAELRRLAGDYEFGSAAGSDRIEARVEVVQGELRFITQCCSYKLVRSTTDTRGVQVTARDDLKVLFFELEGHPDASVRFLMSGDKVDQVVLYHEQPGRPSELLIGVPKK